jgi:hypothetical protein
MITTFLRRASTRSLALTMTFAITLANAYGQETPGETELRQSEVIVTAPQVEQTRRFVETLTIAPRSLDQLARWDSRFCPLIAGATERQAEYIADQVSRRAQEVGLRPGAPGCTPNVVILFTAKSDELAQRMFEEDADVFAYYDSVNSATLGRKAFDAFMNSTAPVRWWHVIQTVGADGVPIRASGGQAPTVRSSGSRLRSAVRQDLARAIIIIDVTRVGGVPVSAIADYVAMVSLAQIDPAAVDPGLPSILTLFSGAASTTNPQPTEMTSNDLAFLKGLYASSGDAVSVRQQLGEIARSMSDGSR